MKILILTALFALSVPLAAFAAPVQAEADQNVNVQLVDGYKVIPGVGALNGTVVSVYAGSAYGLERYLVTVTNSDAPVEGDLMDGQTFSLEGHFVGEAEAVYSRQIDKNTYSIAIITKFVNSENGEVAGKGKILLRVKFTADGVANVAEMTTQKL